jgi:predicted RNA-binding Zn-ribbon protein involved in translation (DUF1610 family)
MKCFYCGDLITNVERIQGKLSCPDCYRRYYEASESTVVQEDSKGNLHHIELSECPVCKNELIQGDASVHGKLFGFLLIGLSHMKCFFKAKGALLEEQTILKPHQRKRAFYCPHCSATLILGSK